MEERGGSCEPSSQKELELAEVYIACRDFHYFDEIPSVNKSQNENILLDELLSSANDPSSCYLMLWDKKLILYPEISSEIKHFFC